MREVVSLSWEEALLRLAVAAALGAAIGLERQLREREAGLRTHLLVSVGAALFTLVSAYGFQDFVESGTVQFDPTRIAAQIVTGIGFIGAGAIIRHGLAVRGLTTAATLWVVAAIGLAAGAGYYSAAGMATAVVIFTLWPLRILADHLVARTRPVHRRLLVDLEAGGSPAAVIGALEEFGVHVESFRREETEQRRRLALKVDLPRALAPEQVVGRLAQVDEVAGARWSR